MVFSAQSEAEYPG